MRMAMALAWKDLRVEYRSREIVYTMTFFAVMVVVLFSFAFLRPTNGGTMIPVAEISPGFLWIAILFAGTLGLGRAFDRERESDTMRGLLLSPMPRVAIFLGKSFGVASLILLVSIIVVPLVVLFFNAEFFNAPVLLGISLLLGAIGFATVGSFFAAMLLRSGARDVLLPVVLYPILVPLFIGGIKSTTGIITGDESMTWFWLRFMLVYDAIFITAGLWIFESLVIE